MSGWDIVFLAQFAQPEPAAVRFPRIWKALSRRPGFVRLTEFDVLRSCETLPRLGDYEKADGAVTDENVNALLREYPGDDISLSGTWRVKGVRNGVPTVGAVIVTAYGPTRREEYRKNTIFERAIDVSWDVGSSRRCTTEGTDNDPNVAQVMADVPVLVELGAQSIWGVDERGTITPNHLHTIFHRDPNDYHNDGVSPPYPAQPIDNETLYFAVELGKGCECHIPTSAGPIIHEKSLSETKLQTYYERLREVLEAYAEDESG